MTATTIGVAIALRTSEAITIRRRWFGSFTWRPSRHLQEPVHVADRLHRPAEAKEEAGSAWHEALPAVASRLAGPDHEGDRLMRLAQRAGTFFTLVGGFFGHSIEGHDQAHLRYRERV